MKRSLEVAERIRFAGCSGSASRLPHRVIRNWSVTTSYLQVFNEIGLRHDLLRSVPGQCPPYHMPALPSAIGGFAVTVRWWVTAVAIETSLVGYAVGSFFASVAFHWYLYYPAAFAVCLQQLLARTEPLPAQREVTPRVWYLRRVQH